MKKLPLISVIIPNYNYARFLSKAISSVENQTYQNTEIIVVNNGSTDNSLSLLKGYGSRIRVIDQENRGQAGARNSGLLAATGELISFLDADDFWQADKLEKQIKLINSDCELVYSGISRLRDASCQVESVVLPKFKGDCHRYFVDLPAVSIVLSGESTVLFTRNLLNRVGHFNVKLNSASGWDFFRRCAKYTNFDYVSESLSNYRLHENNMSKSSISNIEDIRKAYQEMFLDPLWNLSKNEKQKITNRLEFSFVKTFLKEKLFFLAIESMKNITLRKA
jgi:glycosyltransferase involved in cell wall biosynthesis